RNKVHFLNFLLNPILEDTETLFETSSEEE
ncbi:hypothetical protein TNCV_5009391, partial [Trichonephila clavipes]